MDTAGLAGIPLTAGLSDERLRWLARVCPERRFAAGTAPVRQGESASTVLLVTRGRLTAVHETASGERLRCPDAVAPCAVDKAAVLHAADHPYTWTAVEDVTARVMSRQVLAELLATEPSVRDHALRFLSAEVLRARWGRIDDHGADGLRRVSRWLSAAHRGTGGCDIALPGGQQGLAEELGLSRVTVNRALAVLSGRGTVRVRRGRVEVRDPRGLTVTD
ncbi:CRP-like cAMP-binding protein [Stackebrandtia albiflava]|uniref:CRP-like cAMP-binding protein n=1 Tax=Stackebrandtia albiflava TaxID=406432 RepID=A0A562UQC0_9ACTN|nr:Crp/Fnr family transcriptional regulator [Stackebrandtia albiflava]TWJ07825.1 CRP-like cAMP-binding protein [Stackebrandtia albiflava]